MSQLTSVEKIKVLLVDDEPAVRSALKEMLSHFHSIEVVGESSNIPEAVKAIHQVQPNLVFLDIEMPGYLGIQLLEFFNPSEVNFDIVFVTAYNEYAIQAFKIAAFDYLLKPIITVDLEQTIERFVKSKRRQKVLERTQLLKGSFMQEALPSQIAINSMEGIDFLELKNIILFEASGIYTNIIVAEGQTIVASKPIGEFESLLADNTNFFRAHRSFFINLQQVRKMLSKKGCVIIIMKNKMEVPLSRYRKKEFELVIENFRI
ncbi:LytTR family DNA-binding domain-containing protein [Flammeovirgaceae bacterium SG7u.111]|nr:LytTR family DNA-binding domain-containing protein [Flammeovirgaceae bacterium SG7u.132]WPO35732.1 LytTR family DNA-binding domain-containing protein [Flammeovirgaceae bacterium SG7u.111]